MEKFCAEQFYGIACSLEDLKCRFQQITTVGGEHVANFAGYFDDIGQKCESIGLIQSHKAAKRASAEMKGNPAEAIRFHLKAITDLIKSEMENELFFRVPSERAEFYSPNGPLFGSRVADAFPSASMDIEEAGKCFALGRFTASVLHSMRILETGLVSLCVALKVPYEEKSWNALRCN
jgi:hypothetical protein